MRPARRGAFVDERRIVAATKADRARHRRACVSLVASFAAGVREAGARTDGRSSHHRAHRRCHCAAPARRSVFVVERCNVIGDEGGRVYITALRSPSPLERRFGVHPGALIATLVALRPRAAARSPMSGASLPATKEHGV
jgi:hypothetical protein